MTPTILALNSLNTNILTEAAANEIAADLNADAEDDCTYKVEKKDHGFAVAVYDEIDDFVLYL